jgi:hypothetical protein
MHRRIGGVSKLLMLGALFILPISGCISTNRADRHRGYFKGSLLVMWVGEGGASGDGAFLYIPDPNNPLTLHRPHESRGPQSITPEMMYTDGGSIPKIAQMFRGLSPWGYAPAYMIHDWLFVARHCLVDGRKDKIYNSVSGVDFELSSEILGEAIDALVAARKVQEDDLAGFTIEAAVGSVIARTLWDEKDACRKSQISEEHKKAAIAALSGREPPRPGFPPRFPTSSAKIITRMSF